MTEELNIGSIDVVDLEKDLKRANEAGKPGVKVAQKKNRYVNMPEGKGSIVLRILPPAKGGMLVCKTRIHKMNNKMNNKNIHCPMVYNESTERWTGDCEICAYYKYLYSEVDRLTREDHYEAAEKIRAEAKSLKANERYYFVVIVRQELDENGVMQENVGPKIFSCGVKLYSKIIRAFTGDEAYKEPALGDITNWKTGRDLLVIKEITTDGKFKFPNYDRSKFLEPSPLGTKEQVIHWMSNLPDLAAERHVMTSDEIDMELAIYRGLIQGKTGGFDPKAHEARWTTSTTQVNETTASTSREASTASKVMPTNPNPEVVMTTREIEGEQVDIDKFYAELKDIE